MRGENSSSVGSECICYCPVLLNKSPSGVSVVMFGKLLCGGQSYEAQLWGCPPQAGSPLIWRIHLNKEQNADGHRGLRVSDVASVASHPLPSLPAFA